MKKNNILYCYIGFIIVTLDNKRYSLGVFDTEKEALKSYNDFISNKDFKSIKKGKGKSNLGRCKYTNEDNLYALDLAEKIGIRKAGKETGMGSTRICILRKKLKNEA